jgi:putative endonuclease
MYYVYVLFSLKDKVFYVGKTADLEERLKYHERGYVDSTKDRRPLKFLYAEMTPNESDSGHREIYLKTAWGKRYLKARLKDTIYDILGKYSGDSTPKR